MNSSRIAVWLLELVTSSDRAATTVGDFVEESQARGRFWFWRQIVQTFVAQVGREFTSAGPGLIFKCILRSIAYLYFGIAVSGLLANLIWMRVASEQTLPSGITFTPAVPVSWILLASVPLLVRTGWLLAEKYNRPIAATSIFAIVCFFLSRNPNDSAHGLALWISAPVLIGAIWQRRRSLRTA